MGGIPSTGRGASAPVRQAVRLLDEAIGRAPESLEELEARCDAVDRTVRMLGSLDIDGESFVRFGLASRIDAVLLTQVLFLGNQPKSPAVDMAAWRAALELDPDLVNRLRASSYDKATFEEAVATVVRLRRLIGAWIENASFRALVRLTAPTVEQLAAWNLLPTAPVHVTEPYTWLWQRSTVDELDRWATASLVKEFQWQDGQAVTFFTEPAFEGPKPDLGVLTLEVARRLTRPPVGTDINDDTDRLFWQLQDQASEYLRQGRHTDAIALFDFFCRLHPDHDRALNNLGFCTLPVDASAALTRLKAAERKGYRPLAINVINQCWALRALGRDDEALDRLEHFWQRERQDDPMHPGGILWQHDDDDWTLRSESDPLRALCRMAQVIAKSVDAEARVRRWQEREAMRARPLSVEQQRGPTAA